MLRTQAGRFSVALWLAFGGLMVLGAATLSATGIEDNFDGPSLDALVWRTSEDQGEVTVVDGAVRLYSPGGRSGVLSLAEPLACDEYVLQFDLKPEREHWSGYAMTIQHEQGGGKPHYWYIEIMGDQNTCGVGLYKTLNKKWQGTGGSHLSAGGTLDPFKTWYRFRIWNRKDGADLQVTVRDTGVGILDSSFEHDPGAPGNLSFSPSAKTPIGMAARIDNFTLTRGPEMPVRKPVKFLVHTPAWPENPPEHWLTYHLGHPGSGDKQPYDPNPAFYYKGRYHLHYIYITYTGIMFGHVSSKDMVHWKWHPTVLGPQTMGHGMYSGTGFFTKEGKAAMIYHGRGSGRNWIAYALDDHMDKWSKPEVVIPRTADGQEAGISNWDPDCWLNGDTYYALSGGANPGLMKSSDLKNWEYLGALLHDDYPADLGVRRGEDISCANMFKIGNKWMLLCISHGLGCRYYLGDFKDEKYLPTFHAGMNWPGGHYFAPETLLTEDGRRVMWTWMIRLPSAPAAIQSLPRELELPEDGVLRIKPLRELSSLRYDARGRRDITISSGESRDLDWVSGDALELKVEFKSLGSGPFGLDVLCDEQGAGGMRIAVTPERKTLSVGKVTAPFELRDGEDLTLRLFIDKNFVEVFANDRQAVAHAEVKYNRANTAIRLFAEGGDVKIDAVTAWKMKSIYEGDTVFRGD